MYFVRSRSQVWLFDHSSLFPTHLTFPKPPSRIRPPTGDRTFTMAPNVSSFYFPNVFVLVSLGVSYALYSIMTLVLESFLDTCIGTRITSYLILLFLGAVLSYAYYVYKSHKSSTSLHLAVFLFWIFNLAIFLLMVAPASISETACAMKTPTSPASNATTVSRFQFAYDIPFSAVSATTPYMFNRIFPCCLVLLTSRTWCYTLCYFLFVVGLICAEVLFQHYFPGTTIGFAALIPQIVNFGVTYVPDQYDFQRVTSHKIAFFLGGLLVAAPCIILTVEVIGFPVPSLARQLCTAIFSAVIGFVTQMTVKGDKNRATSETPAADENATSTQNQDEESTDLTIVVSGVPVTLTSHQGRITQVSGLGANNRGRHRHRHRRVRKD